MTIMRFKGDSTRIAVTLLSAAVVGGATGLGVAHLSWPSAIGVAIVAGLAAGGLLVCGHVGLDATPAQVTAAPQRTRQSVPLTEQR